MALMTRYNYVAPPPEEGGGESMVESAGYIPSDVRIQELIMAGERLGEYRREAYDYGPDDVIGDDMIDDPLRAPGIDMADVSTMQRQVEQRLKSQAEKKPASPEPAPTKTTEPPPPEAH